ncbi:hypothetical protein NTE_00323 [Candidatus Nitrososphaera evergladensis SR1]|uniref:Uncharacterized protein n=1 Tax=Candidatus Nitrososphaera evergladensis SR1 TaxID=1459636 RepID=A0A075MMN5_9ARCH|nr:hypothetical protein NTE_00323 [Candidatus Nitrososphaera evergladensis SR1]
MQRSYSPSVDVRVPYSCFSTVSTIKCSLKQLKISKLALSGKAEVGEAAEGFNEAMARLIVKFCSIFRYSKF